MRRVITLLVLLAGAIAQAGALDCGMVGRTIASGDGPAGHAHGVATDEHRQDDSPDGSGPHPDCRLIISCAGAFVAPMPAAFGRVDPPAPVVASALDQRAWSTVFPARETPPPRLPV